MIINERIVSIMKVLTLPFTDDSFAQRDLLLEKVQCYRDLKPSFKSFSEASRSERKRKYARIQSELLEHIMAGDHWDHRDDALQLINMFYPDEVLEKYLPPSQRPQEIDQFYLRRIFDITSSFVTLRDGYVSIRMWENITKDELFHNYSGLDKVELWNTLSRMVTPDLFIAAYFVKAGLNDYRNLSNITDNIRLNDTPLSKVLEKGVAETHLHLNAGLSYLSLWEMATDITRLEPKTETKNLLASFYRESPSVFLAGLLRLYMACYIRSGKKGDLFDRATLFCLKDRCPFEYRALVWAARPFALQDLSPKALLPDTSEGICADFLSAGTAVWEDLTRRYGVSQNGASLDALGRGAYRNYQYLNTSCEILFLFDVLKELYAHPEKRRLAMVFLQYIRLKNSFFSDKMQVYRTKGLRYFQDFYQNAGSVPWSAGVKAESIYLSIFKDQCKCTNLRKLEVKTTPRIPFRKLRGGSEEEYRMEIKRAIAKQVLTILESYLKYYEAMALQFNGGPFLADPALSPGLTADRLQKNRRISFPSLGIVFHFIKENDPDNYLGDKCWITKLESGVSSSNRVDQIRRRYMAFTDALSEMYRDIRYFSQYVVGIDAASDELSAEPWVFAPVYEHARRKRNTYPVHFERMETIQNIGLTYHVGEDFRHLLSGLRCVDEVVTHFGYKSGDRLGHALALQISPEEWTRSNEVVVMPIMEYLENLLWLWHLNSQHPEIGAGLSLDLEYRIMDTASKIYSNLMGISPYTLWQAYQMKFQLLNTEKVMLLRQYYLDTTMIPSRVPPLLEDMERNFCLLYRTCGQKGACPYLDAGEESAFQSPSISNADHIWNADKLLMTYYCPVYMQHYRKPIFVQSRPEEISLLCNAQNHLRGKVQREGIYIETNPTSNATIGHVDSLFRHPLLSLDDSLTTKDPAQRILFTVNSDDPLIFNTNVENEIGNIYHLLIHRGFGRAAILEQIERICQYGMDSSFVRRVKKPSEQWEELCELTAALRKFLYLPPSDKTG